MAKSKARSERIGEINATLTRVNGVINQKLGQQHVMNDYINNMQTKRTTLERDIRSLEAEKIKLERMRRKGNVPA